MYRRIENINLNWPSKLKDLNREEPKSLWYEGDIDLLKDKCVCVVGSRRITDYGRRVVERLVPVLVNQGCTIISGFMYGTDQAVHRETMKCGGKTVAVLGWGIKNTRDMNDEIRLMNEIIESGGLMVSEWEKQLGAMWTFPRRDRIMAALATDIYVIEAAIKSGSLITADWGIKLKRQIWAVPGPITSKVSEGTNYLIAWGLAKMWLFDIDVSERVDKSNNKNTVLYNILQNESLTADEISRKLGKPVAEIGAQLSLLELEGKVKERGGKYYLEIN